MDLPHPAAQKHFIFIAGHHRSGTSLLQDIIRSHPEVSGFHRTGVPEDEGQHLQSVYPPARAFGGPGKYLFNSSSRMDEQHPLATPEVAATLFRQWSAYWDLEKKFLLEKSPPNLVRTRFLQALFPVSSFIVILRHPLAVAYATQKWSGTEIPSLIDHTLLGYELFQRDVGYLRRVHVLRYEDLISDPALTMRKMIEFLGLAPAALTCAIEPTRSESYFARWKADGRGRSLMAEEVLHRLDARSRVHGYSLLETS